MPQKRPCAHRLSRCTYGTLPQVGRAIQNVRRNQLAPPRRTTHADASVHTHKMLPHDSAASRAPVASLESHTGAIVCNSLEQFAVLGGAVHRTMTTLPEVTALRHDPRSRSACHRSDFARTHCHDARMAPYPRWRVPSNTCNGTSLLRRGARRMQTHPCIPTRYSCIIAWRPTTQWRRWSHIQVQ